MLLPSRSRTMFQPLSRVCCGVLSALLLLAAPAGQAALSKSRTSRSSKSGATKTPPPASASQPAPSAPEPPPAAASEPAPASAASESKPAEAPPRPVLESKTVAENRPAPAPRPAPVVRPAPASTSAAPTFPGRMRVGLGGDLFVEGGQMNGEQTINTSRTNESFNYSSASFLSATAWLTTSVPQVSERFRVGAGLRIFGNYAAGGGREFGFGLLNEAFVNGEYGLPVADKTEVVLGGRAGLSLLIPGSELSEEIRRLQEQGVSVWSVPRVGWLLGPSAGARRQMSDRIWLRADLNAQVEQQYLFATSQEISGLRFTKNWSTLGLRLGLTLGAEFAL